MRSFGRSLRRHRVEFLLISGQAAVLYGAATFSEDVDIWIRPTAVNLKRFLKALASLKARIHKLTPPLTLENLRKGHGFHFVLPGPVYLDVMGKPPRVGAFETCRRRSVRMKTEWGEILVLSIPDLVEIKKTRRLGDYETISALARIHLASDPARLRTWAARNTFDDPSALGKVARLQKADLRYWKPILADLRRWRREGALLEEGSPV